MEYGYFKFQRTRKNTVWNVGICEYCMECGYIREYCIECGYICEFCMECGYIREYCMECGYIREYCMECGYIRFARQHTPEICDISVFVRVIHHAQTITSLTHHSDKCCCYICVTDYQ